jgi:hypothetical protein
MDYDDLELENIALTIRKQFILLKSQVQKRTYKPHKSHDTPEIWKAAAKKCAELDCNPVDFVQIAFDKATTGPYPKMLGGKAVDRWVSDYTRTASSFEGADNIYEQELEEEIRTAEQFCWSAATSSDKTFEDVVRSGVMPISAYTRIYLCPDPQTIFMYAKEAAKELQGNPGVVAALKKRNMNMDLIFNE